MTDTVTPLIMHRGSPAAWVLMPQFLERVTRFMQTYGVADQAWAVREGFSEAFGAGSGEWLGVALLRGPGEMVGHLLGCVETRTATKDRLATIWQWEKDASTERVLDLHVLQLVETWAARNRCSRVAALAASASRAKLFRRFGFNPGSILITKEVPT